MSFPPALWAGAERNMPRTTAGDELSTADRTPLHIAILHVILPLLGKAVVTQHTIGPPIVRFIAVFYPVEICRFLVPTCPCDRCQTLCVADKPRQEGGHLGAVVADIFSIPQKILDG